MKTTNKMMTNGEISLLRKKYFNKNVKIISGDYKGKIYLVDGITAKGHLSLKDLYGLNSKKKSYSWKVHHSNTKIQ